MLASNHSFTETAYQAHISQPSVSLAIKRLERQLGKSLVERRRFGAGGIQLTAAGQVAVNHVKQILAELDSMGAAVRETGRTRTWRIGMPPIISSLLAWQSGDQPLPSTLLTGPVSLCTVGSGRLLEQMREHQVDYGTVASVQDRLSIPDVLTVSMVSYPFGLAGSHSALEQLVGGEFSHGLRADDLDDLPESVRFVTLNHEFIHAQAAESLLRRHVPASRIIEVGDVETLKTIAEAGIAFSFITSAGLEGGDGLEFLPFTDPNAPQFNIFLFRDQSRYIAPEEEAGLKAFNDYARCQLSASTPS